MAETTVAMEPASQASSYRVKFGRDQFLELVDIAKPKIIYRRKKNHFFSFDGFVMYSQECTNEDFVNQKVVEAMELSNYMWAV
jgi:hypothetical protein